MESSKEQIKDQILSQVQGGKSFKIIRNRNCYSVQHSGADVEGGEWRQPTKKE